MLTYKKKGGVKEPSKRKSKKPKSVGTNVPRLKKGENIIKLPPTNSSTKKQKNLNLRLVEKRRPVKRLLSKSLRRLWKFPFLPPPLPIFEEPSTTTLPEGQGRFLPITPPPPPQQISELPFNREDGQKTYLLFGHGDPLKDIFGRPEKIRRGKQFFKKMRFGVTANDGGSCFPSVENHRYFFTINEHTLGYRTPERVPVTAFERRYPTKKDGKLEFLNFLISEGYWEESNFFPSGIWRVSKGKIELFGITEVADQGFVNGIDLTQDTQQSAKQGFLNRFIDTHERPRIASRVPFTFETLLDKIHADAGDAEVVNVLIQTCSGLETTTDAGREASKAWRGQSKEHPPYIF
jgi:hypothetical protein